MRSLLCDPNTRRIERGNEELFTRWKSKPEKLLWLDFDKELRRIFTYHGQVFRETGRLSDLALVTRYEHDLTDIAEQVNRSANLADLYYEQAADLTEAYLGLSAHRLNQVMQVLTIITVIFVPLSFLAGIYGMNFDNMPELHSRFGYFVLLGIMACVVSVQIYFFRKKRWL